MTGRVEVVGKAEAPGAVAYWLLFTGPHGSAVLAFRDPPDFTAEVGDLLALDLASLTDGAGQLRLRPLAQGAA